MQGDRRAKEGMPRLVGNQAKGGWEEGQVAISPEERGKAYGGLERLGGRGIWGRETRGHVSH